MRAEKREIRPQNRFPSFRLLENKKFSRTLGREPEHEECLECGQEFIEFEKKNLCRIIKIDAKFKKFATKSCQKF